MFQSILTIQTSGKQIFEITHEIQSSIKNIKKGLCHLFIQHTSASLIICENADPQVLADLENFMSKWVVDGDPLFQHRAEGKDDMPAHIRTVMTQTSLTIPIMDNRLALGTWQGLFVWEHRLGHFKRQIVLTIVSD